MPFLLQRIYHSSTSLFAFNCLWDLLVKVLISFCISNLIFGQQLLSDFKSFTLVQKVPLELILVSKCFEGKLVLLESPTKHSGVIKPEI